MKIKTALIAGVLVVALIAASWYSWNVVRNQTSTQSSLRTAIVQRGSVKSSLSSSGTARAGKSASVAWQTSGKVTEVSLQVGDQVQAGQELAALDPNTLPTSMVNARQSLVDAKQALDDLLKSKLNQAKALQALESAQIALDSLKQTAAADSSAAQLALATAQQALVDAQKARTAMNYPHSSDPLVVENAETKYLLAKQAYKDALKAYELVAHKRLTALDRANALDKLLTAKQKMNTLLATYNWYLLKPSPLEIAKADANLAVAKANVDKAQADWDLKKNGTSSAAVKLAEATLADAQREWDRLKNGPSADDIAAAQAAVDAALATLEQVHLVAPFDGIITKVDARTGDDVTSGSSAFRVDDLSAVYVDLQISEVDIKSLNTGQQASLTFDAISNKTYNGEVTAVGVIGTVSQGVVNYPVTVHITDADENVHPGMTAAVSIVVDQHDDVLMVPSRAIRTSSGQRTVTVLFEGQQIVVPVTVGLTGDNMSEVTSNQLREGDEVILTGTTTTSSSPSSQNRNNPGGPGGPSGLFR